MITFNKEGKRAAEQAKLLSRYEEERAERENAMLGLRETQDRVGRATTYGRSDDSDELLGGRSRMKTEDQLSARKEQRKRYQFEANASDDEVEDEIDSNLDEISAANKRLGKLALAMGGELNHQNKWIDNIAEKTDRLDDKLRLNTERVRPYYSKSKSVFD